MLKAFRYRLNPTNEQKQLLSQWEGSTRWLWNHLLDLENQQYAKDKTFIWEYDLSKLLPNIKKQNPWMINTPSQAYQQVAKSLSISLKHIKIRAYPTFKKKGVNCGQITIPNSPTQIFPSDSHIKLPKIGPVRWYYHRPIPKDGKIKQAQITKDIDHWYVSILVELPNVVPTPIDPSTAKSIGLDLGIAHFLIDSNGEKVSSPKFLKQKLRRIKRYQRQLSRKQKGSQNREKAKVKLAKQHRSVRNARKNWLHQLSHRIVTENELICAEGLRTKDLMKRRNSNRPMNQRISDQGWGMFLGMLAYKCEHYGKTFTQLSRWAASTKTCSDCGHKMSNISLEVRNWTCPSCGSEHDRDINAALNIKFWGIMQTPNTDGTSEINACGVL